MENTKILNFYKNSSLFTDLGLYANFAIERKIEDKIHVCCREMSILLIAILKVKNIPARARCGWNNNDKFRVLAGEMNS